MISVARSQIGPEDEYGSILCLLKADIKCMDVEHPASSQQRNLTRGSTEDPSPPPQPPPISLLVGLLLRPACGVLVQQPRSLMNTSKMSDLSAGGLAHRTPCPRVPQTHVHAAGLSRSKHVPGPLRPWWWTYVFRNSLDLFFGPP